MKQSRKEQDDFILGIPIIFIVIILAARYFEGHLLFHSLAELFTILVALTMAIVAYHTYNFTKNNFLLYLGMGYFWIALLDLFHMLTYKGMMVYSVNSANVTLTFWVLARLFETLLIMSAPFIRFTLISRTKFFLIFGFFGSFVYWLAFSEYRPSLYIEDSGLTLLKIGAEYTIIALLFIALLVYQKQKKKFDISVYRYIIMSIIFTISAELAFTLYIDIHGFFTVLGHIFKFLSYWMIFLAIIQTSLQKPFMFMSQESKTYNAIPFPAVVVDSEGIIRQINKTTETFLNLTKDEILHHSNHTLFHNKNVKESECKICKMIQNGSNLSSYELYRDLKTYSFTTSSIHLENETTGAIQVCIDISDRKKAENKLNQIMEKSPVAIVITDAEGNIEYVNPWFTKITGYSFDEVKGENPKVLKSYYHSEDDYLKLWDTISHGKVWTGIFKNIKKNGEEFWESSIIAPVMDDYGEIVNYMAVKQEITEQIYLQEALEKQKELSLELGHILEESLNEIYILDKESMKFLYVNKGARNNIGYSSEELVNLTPFDISPQVTKEQLMGMLKVFGSNKEKALFLTTEHQRKDGTTYPIDVYVQEGLYNGTMCYVAIIIDTTEREAMQKKLYDREEIMIAQSRHAAMGEMIGMIAHQWRQPLSVISMGANNLLLDIEMGDIDTTDIKNETNSILKQVNHLSQTIEDFRNFFRPDREKEFVSVKDIIDETLSIIGKSLENNDIKINLSFSSTPVIETYKRELIQVLINIFNNAKEAMNQNCKDEKKLLINVKEETETVKIEVCDNGGGIDEEIIDKIFEPYFSTKNKQTGTGLGLYMSKTIVNKHLNGEITAKNNENGGVCLIVSLYK